MQDENRTKAQLIDEVERLRRRVAELEALDAERERTEFARQQNCAHLETLVAERTAELTRVIEQLKHNEERLTLAIVGTGGALWDEYLDPEAPFDTQSSTVYYSPEEQQLLGYGPGEPHTSTSELAPTYEAWYEHIFPADRDAVEQRQRAHFEGEIPYLDHEYRVRLADGTIRWVHGRSCIIRDENGRPIRWIGIDWDITEQKRAAAELEHYRENLADLVAERTAELHASNAELAREITERKLVEAIVQRRGEVLTALYQAGQQFNQTLDTQVIFQYLYDWVIKLMSCDTFFISSFSSVDQLIRCEFAIQENKVLDVSVFPSIPLAADGKGIQSTVIRSGQPLLIADYQQYLKNSVTTYSVSTAGEILAPDDVPEGEAVTQSALLVPMILAGQVAGVIQVMSFEEDAFTEEQLHFLELLASQVAVAFNNALLYQQARDEITERQRAEAALKDSERMLETILLNMPGGTLLVGEDYRIYQVNRRTCEITGYTEAELVGEFCDIICPKGAASKACPIWAKGQDSFTGMDTAVKCKGGTKMPVLKNAQRITVNDKHYILENFQDITERKQMEAALQASAAQYRATLDAMGDVIYLVDTDLRLTLVNDACQKWLMAYAANTTDPIGQSLLSAFSPVFDAIDAELRAQYRLVFETGDTLISEETLRFKGLEFVTETRRTPIFERDRVKHVVTIMRDITARKQAEREREMLSTQMHQQERLAAVGQLAAGIAHDFNNIMAVIVLYAQMAARSGALPRRDRERMGIIDQQAQHASQLITQILDFSRRAVLEQHPLDLRPLLKEQTKLLSRTLPESIEIIWSCEDDAYTVNADPTRMQQMLTNLAVNARDAMLHGGTLRVELSHCIVEPDAPSPLPELTAGIWVCLSVTDTGTGIPEDVLPHIYEPFFTTKAVGDGSGLGLAQVHGIVGQHGGYIDVQTQLGVGTTFTIYLPALYVPSPKSVMTGDQDAPVSHGEQVLVVEDEAILRRVFSEILQSLNYRVLEAANGLEALDVMAEQGDSIALVLSDVVMPKMGGIDLLHTLRERGRQTPVILLTGHPMDREFEDLRREGLSAWLLKPPDFDQLARALARALGKEA